MHFRFNRISVDVAAYFQQVAGSQEQLRVVVFLFFIIAITPVNKTTSFFQVEILENGRVDASEYLRNCTWYIKPIKKW